MSVASCGCDAEFAGMAAVIAAAVIEASAIDRPSTHTE
jgi:hypothetical protein